MKDPSFGVPRHPDAGQNLDVSGANAIEENLRALILAWPCFESETISPLVGSYGYLQLDESASPALGVQASVIQHLPRFLVLLEGEGLENLSWTGPGWRAEGKLLVYDISDPYVHNANAALELLVFSSSGDADATVTLAGENPAWEPGGLRLIGLGRTALLFRGRATWGLAKAKKKTWGGANPLTWGQAAALRKDD